MAEVPELSQSASGERAQEEAPETIELIEAEGAILIFKKADGSISISTDINIPISVERTLSGDEIKALLNKILEDTRTQEIAFLAGNAAAAAVQAAMRQAVEQQLNSQLLSNLPKGLAK
jgi:hypothetical protein